MLSLGSIIFGFILGFIIGTQIKKNSNFSYSSYIIIIIAGVIMAWQLGEFPFYNNYVPLSTAFISALIGVLLSKILFSRSEA